MQNMRYFDFAAEWSAFCEAWNREYTKALFARTSQMHGLKLPVELNPTAPSFEGFEHGCHALAPVIFHVAFQLHPEIQWVLVHGDRHSTVLSEELGVVFDPLFWWFSQLNNNFVDATSLTRMVLGIRRGPVANTYIIVTHARDVLAEARKREDIGSIEANFGLSSYTAARAASANIAANTSHSSESRHVPMNRLRNAWRRA
jgi:hypothetical protein